VLDYKRILCSKGCLISLEKNKSHSGFIGLMFFFNGFFTYIIIPNRMSVGTNYNGFSLKFKKNENYTTFLYNIPTGNSIHHIACKPNTKATVARAAGN